ncbi:MAG TPA: MGMT family protein [Oligoflexia bacterium]|nr:MGMT family protein [Oligoflexia bacterium]HMP27431.1 MGMT family protein [Oligoflexia bacterium]
MKRRDIKNTQNLNDQKRKQLQYIACYNLLKKIPLGSVTTYAILAKALKLSTPRALGRILGANPNAPKIPCHRVIRSNGEIGGYAYGTDKKITLLQKEGIKIKNGKILNLKNNLYRFKLR